ncbi:SPRY domain-containing protein [Anaeroselena agilis]|uniref:SPRY domain-containing protein n=1 Tax=Anaeroselena agilis TaxID=3063788 RepID=A0ABU3NX06_9FIRM|nr:SPRY domain-containing protein [Selenomonadales bacterium 4137-cl]
MAQIIRPNLWSQAKSIGSVTITKDQVYYIQGQQALAEMGKTSGKWFFEVQWVTGSVAALVAGVSCLGFSDYRGWYANTGQRVSPSTGYQNWEGTGYTYGDYIGVAVDLNEGTIGFYRNGVFRGTAFTDLKTMVGLMYPGVWAGGTGNYTIKINSGAPGNTFQYPAPSGYKPWCIAGENNNAPSMYLPKTYRKL